VVLTWSIMRWISGKGMLFQKSRSFLEWGGGLRSPAYHPPVNLSGSEAIAGTRSTAA